MPPSQKLPESPREAIQLIRDECSRLETAPWVRNYQGGGTASMSSTSVQPQVSQSIQAIGLGFTSLAVFAVESATQQHS